MRRSDETHDPGIGAFSGRGRRLHFESFAGVHGAASQAIAGAMDSGQWFARQRGLVEGSRRRKESAVDGHDLACSHEDDVAMPDRIDDLEALRSLGIGLVDIVIVNLYPFVKAASNPSTSAVGSASA